MQHAERAVLRAQVLQTMPAEERKALTPIQLRHKARDFALKTVDSQRSQFKRYGVWGDWDTPYVTLNPEYEAAQIGVFGKVRSFVSSLLLSSPFFSSVCFVCSCIPRCVSFCSFLLLVYHKVRTFFSFVCFVCSCNSGALLPR